MNIGVAAEHPRPDQRRDSVWWSLNGPWEFFADEGYAIDSLPSQSGAIINVPFAWESPASGVERHWLSRAWYRRDIDAPELPGDQRLVLHFGAVHHAARVWLDGLLLTTHVGGQTPFEVDITDVVGQSPSSLVVCVDAPIDKGAIPHGKQRSMPADPYDVCSFTPSSGIWQTVWLEQRPATHLASARVVALSDLTGFEITVAVVGDHAEQFTVRARVVGTGEQIRCERSAAAVLTLASPRLWSPDDPHLYEVEVELSRAGAVVDRLSCTAGLRSVTVTGQHLFLNGERLFLRGVLDQGYWPDSGWTAPGLEALVADLQAAKDAGFTLVRKHLKLEDPRWLHAADRLGMLVWEEPASTSRYSPEAVAAFEAQIPAMVTRDINHPCIVIWGLYNEEWGLDWDVADDVAKQQTLAKAYALAKSLDGSRPVIDNSGWTHVRTDLNDWHVYSADHLTWAEALADLRAGGEGGFVVDLGPGGATRKHVNANRSSSAGTAGLNSEYGTGTTSVERAWSMRWQTQELRRMDDLNGYVYTELYDIEHETAGVLTDHRRPKDSLGLVPADSHHETVIVVDTVPVSPGSDLVTGPDGDFEVDLRLSHHGPDTLLARLKGGWGAALSTSRPAAGELTAQLKAEPFVLSEPVRWPDRLPDGVTTARLHWWVLSPGGDQVAHAVLDVTRGATEAVRPLIAPNAPPVSL